MLEKLIIKNYLLLKDIEITFSEGFNIITGETGAGKSILINALSLVLGERADYSIISKNKEKMIVECFIKIYENNQKVLAKFLKGFSIDMLNGEHIIIRRELYSKGYARNFINDSPVNITELKSLGDLIIDIHSQNEHQSLLRKETHIELLDSFISSQKDIKFNEELEDYRQDYNALLKLTKEFEAHTLKKTELEDKRSFLEFQLKEINELDPKVKEDEGLEKEIKVCENIEDIQKGLASAYLNLYEDRGSVTERIKTIEKELERISEFDSDITQILKDIHDSSSVLNEISRQVQGIMNNLSFDPQRLETIRERIYKLQYIKKKYGGSLDEVIKLKNNLKTDLSLLNNFDEKIGELETQIKSLKGRMITKAQIISSLRKEKSKIIEGEIIKVLKEVGLENADFKVDFTYKLEKDSSNLTVKIKKEHIKLTIDGIDDTEFLVKVNKGDEFSPLRKTASGGEISRIMLAVKAVLADADKVGVLIFDEIDAGISGRIAQKVGRVLKKLSASHQVISITHLAQIAALADEHFLVEKEVKEDKTLTKIKKLNNDEKVVEVAKLLSGEKVTDSSIKSARELIRA